MLLVYSSNKLTLISRTKPNNIFLMRLSTISNPNQIVIDKLRAALRSFNQAIAGEFEYNSIYIFAEDEFGELIGGIYGKIAWNWLYIDLLWVHPEYRKKGLGSSLMKAMEKEAHKEKIYSYHLSTASFQAPIFYQKLGYQICGEIKGLPPGYTTYFLKKQD